MNKTMKTTKIVAGTAVATGVALNYITDGAVKDSLADMFHNAAGKVSDVCNKAESVADAAGE